MEHGPLGPLGQFGVGVGTNWQINPCAHAVEELQTPHSLRYGCGVGVGVMPYGDGGL